jgi:hypothetical protein
MTDVNIFGRVRGALRTIYGAGAQQPALADGGEVLVAQALPELTELVRQGNSFHVLSAATAALTAVPGTTAGLSLWNGEDGGGKSYAIDSFGCVEVVTDITQQNSLALFAMMNRGRISPPVDAGLSFGSMAGKTYNGYARVVAAATVADHGWTPHGPSSPGATALAGAVWRVTEFQARGLYLVPPGLQFNIAVAKTVATASQIRYFIRWHEVNVTVG